MVKCTSICVVALALFAAATTAAQAGLKICNKTEGTVSVAFAHKTQDGWQSEGWWTLETEKCRVLYKGNLLSQFYYIHAVDTTKGAWTGRAQFCVAPKAFTIKQVGNCAANGYEQKGFWEVNTKDQADWTVNLTGVPDTPAKR